MAETLHKLAQGMIFVGVGQNGGDRVGGKFFERDAFSLGQWRRGADEANVFILFKGVEMYLVKIRLVKIVKVGVVQKYH